MRQVEKTVFISYRRTNIAWALALSQSLTSNGFDVFIDYTGLNSGSFEQAILENIRHRAHFLVILTPSALERCSEKGDWLRREIEEAIDCKRNIIPLMMESFDFGAPSVAPKLTGKLASLKNYNALTVSGEYFDEAIMRLRDGFLNIELEAVRHPLSERAEQTVSTEKAATEAAPPVTAEELTAEVWFERGYSATDPDEQLRCYTEAIRLDPDDAAAYYNRGNAHDNKGEYDKAIADFNEAIRLDPDYATAYNNRGLAHKNKGEYDKAIADFNEAIRLDPDYATAYNNRGLAHNNKGEYDKAIADFNEAIRLNPDDATAYNNRGFFRAEQGDYAEAIIDCNEAIRLNPDYADFYHSRGFAYEKNGDRNGAIIDYNQALRLDPKHPEIIEALRRLKGNSD